MTNIVQMSKGGTKFYPQTHVQAVLGLNSVGTNLLTNSNFSSGLDHWIVNGGTNADCKAVVTTDSDGDACIHITGTGNACGIYCTPVSFNQNQVTTGSVLAKGTGAVNLVGLRSRPTSNFGTVSIESYSKVGSTMQAGSNTNNFVVYFNQVNGVLDIYIKFAKLEKGPIATDYSLNPLDIATSGSVDNDGLTAAPAFVGLQNRTRELEKIVDRNYLTYKTISSTLYSTGAGISDDNINAILRVGGTLAMPIMVTVTSSTDPNIVMQSDDRVQQNIDHIKSKGLDITMIKPHIGLAGEYDGFDRATYEPSDFGVFFKNWKDVMLHYSETCDKNGIPILCIGCEQEKCTNPKYIANWVDIYQSIKAKYPNLLITYAMNDKETEDIAGQGQIAQAVDLVGFNIYPDYINKNYDDSVTQDELISGWYLDQRGRHYMDMFDSYATKYGKPIFVTETGSMPWKDGLARLMSLQEGNQDFSGQAAAYQATFEAFSQNPNIVGVSIWNTNAPFNFTSPNKTTESELVLKEYFKGGLI